MTSIFKFLASDPRLSNIITLYSTENPKGWVNTQVKHDYIIPEWGIPQ